MYGLNKNIVVAHKLFFLNIYIIYSNTKMFQTFPISIHFCFHLCLNFNYYLKNFEIKHIFKYKLEIFVQ